MRPAVFCVKSPISDGFFQSFFGGAQRPLFLRLFSAPAKRRKTANAGNAALPFFCCSQGTEEVSRPLLLPVAGHILFDADARRHCRESNEHLSRSVCDFVFVQKTLLESQSLLEFVNLVEFGQIQVAN